MSDDLDAARHHLAKAEAGLFGDDGAFHLDEGLYLLEQLASSGSAEAETAANLGVAYGQRCLVQLATVLGEPDVPQTQLQQMLKLAQTLEDSALAAGASTSGGRGSRDGRNPSELRRIIANRLVDSYFEGYTPEEKQRQIDALMERL
jgi:hypothetical protein